ncbi:MAG: hypothetical protein RI973_1113 [Bacteroidota bacterium]|jgi:glycosyltransferase involved in cell wall biosynthesis
MIAFAHYSTNNDVSGVTTWLEQLAVWLHQGGYELEFHLQHVGEDTGNSTMAKALASHGIPYEIVPRSNYTEDNVRSLLSFLDRKKPRLFIPQCIHAYFYAAMLGGRKGLPWIFTMHANDPYYWAMVKATRPEDASGKIVCVSDFLQQSLLQLQLSKDPVKIPCGVQLPERRATFSNRPFRVVYSGRVVEFQKRISLVAATMIAACELSPHIECIIAGDGDALGSIRQQVLASPVSRQIRFTGRCTPEEVRTLLLDCQAILLMSDFEGLPVAILEAMAAGVVPVVRHSDSGLPELIAEGDSGCWCPDDPLQAARKLLSLSEDPARWDRLSRGARERVAQGYDMEENFHSWKAVIDGLLAGSQPAFPLAAEGDGPLLPPLPEGMELIDTRKPDRSSSFFSRLWKKARGRDSW